MYTTKISFTYSDLETKRATRILLRIVIVIKIKALKLSFGLYWYNKSVYVTRDMPQMYLL